MKKPKSYLSIHEKSLTLHIKKNIIPTLLAMLRQFIIAVVFLFAVMESYGMDFGLRFQSHSYPLDQRTSLSVGDTSFDFEREFKIGFHFNFYATPMFGYIVTLTTNDGQRVSVVASRMDDDSYRPALVVNDKLSVLNVPLALDITKEDKIDLSLDKRNGLAKLRLNNSEIEAAVDLSKTKSVKAVFGVDLTTQLTDAAPIELRNIRIFINEKNTNHWDFKFHDSKTLCLDDIGGLPATVTNPHWLIDDHTDWTPVYSLKTQDKIQTAFNPINETFYLIDDKKIVAINPVNGDRTAVDIVGGRRVMAYSNHLVYDTIGNAFINYNLNRKSFAKIDLSSKRWFSSDEASDEEPNYSNHAVAIDGQMLYAFGGYGFYKFHNDLFTVDLSTGQIVEHKLTPAMMPMTSSAAAVVGDRLYIFGGKGNDSGRQELPSQYHYALYAYDINTWKGEKLWELDSITHNFHPTQTMYYHPEDDSFYMATTCNGGQLIRISRKTPDWNVASTSINSKMEFYDFVFDLYRSADGNRYYLLIDKRLDTKNHDLTIYKISAPFLHDQYLINHKTISRNKDIVVKDSYKSLKMWGIVLILGVVLAIILIMVVKRRKPHENAIIESLKSDSQEKCTDIASNELPVLESTNEDFTFFATKNEDEPKYFDRTRSSISLLGSFCVKDKEGHDITIKFTERLKHLLIMLLLSSQKYENGIKYQTIDEEIWSDKDDKSAQNNRNVSMRKLRLLLESVGNVIISYDKGFFKIETNEVLFDYKELKSRIGRINDGESVTPELVNQILELLLMGPLLPNTSYDWLDKYKSEFSDSALAMLSKLLKYELGRDDNLAYRIADTISLHDILNEEALFAKCRVLSKRKMLGLAKNIHAKFCKEYLKSMGEDYPVSFADACKKEI